MKIDKTNPRHWLYLIRFALNVVVALLLRPFLQRRRQRKRVLLYGHRLSGNLLALYLELCASPELKTDVAFLTMDPAHHQDLIKAGRRSLLATSMESIRWLAWTDAIVTDHGLHALLPLLFLSNIKFFDVWHGVPFKGFDPGDFRVQRHYDETWVASPLLARMYVERFGFHPERVIVTGYARTDRLVRRNEDVQALRKSIGAPLVGPLILFAPTWAQDASGRSIYPFGHTEAEFLGALSAVASRRGATILLRTHLNSADVLGGQDYPNVLSVPFGRNSDTEGILLISDLLICDWSSIAFDYLLLDRPTIFLDVPAPFRKGFSLDQKYRYGALARDLRSLLKMVDSYLVSSCSYYFDHNDRAQEIKENVFGACADGCAGKRYCSRLLEILDIR